MGTEVETGQARTVIVANATTQIKAKPGRLAKLIVWGVGTAWVIDIYDHASAETNPIFKWVTADGIGVRELSIPCLYGIRVVASGTTAGSCTVTWS